MRLETTILVSSLAAATLGMSAGPALADKVQSDTLTGFKSVSNAVLADTTSTQPQGSEENAEGSKHHGDLAEPLRLKNDFSTSVQDGNNLGRNVGTSNIVAVSQAPIFPLAEFGVTAPQFDVGRPLLSGLFH